MKVINKNFWFNLLVFFLIIAVLGAGVKLLFKREVWVKVEIWGTAGEWWWQTESPPEWIANAVSQGDVERDVDGKVIAEVLSIEKFTQPSDSSSNFLKKEFLIKARLKVVKNPKSGILRYRGDDLAIGKPLTLSFTDNSVTGNIVWIEGVVDQRQETEVDLTLKLYDRYPWEAEAISVGSVATDGINQIAQITNKKIDLAEMTVVTDKGEVFARVNPLKRDITLKLLVKAVKVDDQYFFSVYQPIKIGGRLIISFPRYDLLQNVIIDIKEAQ